MKQAYFTGTTIDAVSQQLLRELAPRKREVARPFPDGSALLVLDMQRFFLDPGSHAHVPSAPAIVPRLRRLAELFLAAGRPVIRTRHANTPADAGAMARWWRELLSPDSPAAEFVPELRLPGAPVVAKTQYDAFFRTDLEDLLRARGVSRVVVTGVMTHLCCETTARAAFVRGFDVLFPVDGTATYDLDFHRSALRNLAHGFATLTLVHDLLAQGEGV